MTTKHTPGPWKATKWERDNLADGFEYAITDSRGHGIVIFNQKGKHLKALANARLIAAAPEYWMHSKAC